MKHPVYFGIALRIVFLFSIAMAFTFIPEHLRDFFGDKPQTPNGDIDAEWDWGSRHYWFVAMMFFLFLLSFVNLIVAGVRLVRKHYDTSKW